jgi:hypothetical protein
MAHLHNISFGYFSSFFSLIPTPGTKKSNGITPVFETPYSSFLIEKALIEFG